MKLNSEIRVPVQKRSRDKFEKTLQAAETLILKVGLENTSIPEIAKIISTPRATIYQYFPDKYVLYAYLAQRHMLRIAETLETKHPAERCTNWKQYLSDLLYTSVNYYNENPVARQLLLNGPFGNTDLEAHKAKHITLSDLIIKAMGAAKTRYQFPESPNVLIIALEIGFACIRYGYWYEEVIHDKVVKQAELVIISYLEHYISG